MSFKKLFYESSIYVILTIIQKGLSFLLIPFYTFFLKPDEFGLVNQIIALHSIYIVIITFSLNEALAKGFFDDEHENPDINVINVLVLNFCLVLIGGAILTLGNYLFYELIIGEINFELISLSIAIVLFTPIFNIYQKYLRINNRAKAYAIVMLLYILSQVIFSVLFLYVLSLGTLGYMLSLATTIILFGFLSYYKLFDKSDLQFISLDNIKAQLLYAIKLVPHTLAGWGMKGFTNVALGNLGSTLLVGIFNAVNILGILIKVLSKSLLDAFQPWIYKILKSKQDNNIIAEAVNILCQIIVLLGILLMIFDNFILNFAIDSRYHVGNKYAPLLILNGVLLSIGSMTVYVIYYFKEKVQYVSIATVVGAITNITLGYYLITVSGIIGAILSLILANLVISVIKINISSRIIGKSYGLNNLLLSILIISSANYLMEDDFIVLLINISASLFIVSTIVRSLLRIKKKTK